MAHLIGIGHKKGVGKDTVAKIIQCLTNGYPHNQILIAFEQGNLFPAYPLYANKKFADKLKDIVCILIGCTRKQLEDPEFKETPLGEQWTKYPVSVDTVINPLDSENCQVGEELYYFTTKEEAERFANKETVEGYDYEAEAFVEDKEILTPSKLLQELETNVCEHIHPSTRVNALFADYQPYQKKVFDHNFDMNTSVTKYPKWIISDVKFPDEVQAIKDRRGFVVKVSAPITDPTNEAESEKALKDYEDWDWVIQNDGTIEDLVVKVEEMLKQFKIIF
jgi:hypothetical protein